MGVIASGIVAVVFKLGNDVAIILVCVLPLFLACIMKKLPIMECKVLQFLGGISYPLYLVHQNLSYEIEYYLTQYFGLFRIVYGVLAFVVTIPLAYTLHKIEIYVTRRLKNYANKMPKKS